MTKHILRVVAALAIIASTSCRLAPPPLSFDSVFSGESSGAGYVFVDRLSPDRTKGIVVHVNIIPETSSGFDTRYRNLLRKQGFLHLSVDVGNTNVVRFVRVYEFTNAVSDFTWYHGNFEKEVSRCWQAESGHVTVDLTKPSGILFTATVSLSNVVFAAPSTRQKSTLSSLVIPDVSAGGARL